MKKITSLIILLSAILNLSSCSETDYPLFDDSVINIYFTQDSVNYSFAFVPIEIKEHIVELPIQIIGNPSKENRTFTVEIVKEKTDATEDVHYRLPKQLSIPADSITGIIPLTLLRDELKENEWEVTLRLVKDNNFIPIQENEAKTKNEITIAFSDIVKQPSNWLDYNNEWPSSILGPWNPLVYRKYMEFFQQTKETNPVFYQDMTNKYGTYLEREIFGGTDYTSGYNYTFKKYIFLPLYKYFNEEHPELGIIFPYPNM